MSAHTSALRGLRITRLELSSPGGWWLAFATTDTDLFAAARAIIRDLPEHERRWTPGERAWWNATGALRVLAAMLPDVADALEAWRHGDGRAGAGASSGGGASSGWASGAHGGGDRSSAGGTRHRASSGARGAELGVPPADVRDALALLHVLPTANPELVKAAYRIASKTTHPDHGGSHAAMVELNRAYPTALEWVERRAGIGRAGAA